MAGFKSGITGADKIMKALEKLPNATRRKALRPALRKGAKPVQKAIIDDIKSDLTQISTHTLEKNIIIRAGRARDRSQVRVVVAIDAKKLNPKNAQRIGLYGSVREFGKEGQAPNPAFRPGAQAAAPEAINIVVSEATSNLEAAVREAKK